MKVKNFQIQPALAAVGELLQRKDLPALLALHAAKLNRALAEQWEDVNAARRRVVLKYVQKDSDGNPLPGRRPKLGEDGKPVLDQDGRVIEEDDRNGWLPPTDPELLSALSLELEVLFMDEFDCPRGIREHHFGGMVIPGEWAMALQDFIVE